MWFRHSIPANGVTHVFVLQWGYDFRKEYGKLNELQKEFPGVPMIALSAPIGPSIQKDIRERLQMTNPRE